MNGIKHIVDCRCILPQYKNVANPVFHKFIVFSIIEDDDSVRVKFAQCNNCGIIHKITDICKSSIIPGREQMNSIPTISDLKTSFPDKLISILETHGMELPHWEHAKFILDNQRWGERVNLSSDIIDGQKQIKYVKFISANLFSVEQCTYDEFLTNN